MPRTGRFSPIASNRKPIGYIAAVEDELRQFQMLLAGCDSALTQLEGADASVVAPLRAEIERMRDETLVQLRDLEARRGEGR